MKKLLINAVTLAAGGVFFGGLSAFSQTELATTSYGGDLFELWQSSGIDWTTAEANAVGLGGTLAVLTSSAQTTAVYNGLINNGFFVSSGGYGAEAWLGAIPAIPDGDGATSDPTNWKWVTGDSWTAFDAGNFEGGEPNGDFDSALAMNLDGSPQWNDEGNTSLVGGYIVEVASVPDGGLTIAMLGAAASGLALIRRKL